ncbi:outer membrane beta-barrel protein [Christiangramia crocea]|uniref:TonB-dependent receptor n=1 Tax=Christiangramia crocea TaxID=2904124 RepID=A0A9X1UW86_9FLAO|nr:outer membrane beta-barrel family protein [Gramella crocea]MCG9971453.1 TonB-dependent receptor [Gramella crocea]
MIIKKFTPYIFLLLSCLMNAQSELKGSITDKNNDPVAFANVILLNSQDSTSVYKGTISEVDGSFEFEKLEDSSYLLKITYVGYEDILQKITVEGDTRLNSLKLIEDSGALDEITINARKPKISREVDRLVFDVENSNLSSGNTWEILRKAPGVIESQGQLMVRNSSVQIYLNDRKIYLSAADLKNLLESYSAENIKSIEIITNPPAKYDAEGGAILSIHTSKAIAAGYKGSIEGSYTQAIYPKFQMGTSHYFQGEKLNVFANYSYSERKEFKSDDSYINFIRNGEPFSRWETDFERITNSEAHNVNTILDYNLNDHSALNFSMNANVSPNRKFDNDVTTRMMNSQRQLDSTLITKSGVNYDESNVALNLSYNNSFENGGELSIATHYTIFDRDRTQGVNSRYFNPSGELLNSIDFLTQAAQDINILTGQIDYSGTIGNTTFSLGAKYSEIDSESGINYSNEGDLEDLYDNLSDNFVYDENIYALYTSFSHDWEKWSAKAGLRGEYTNRTGESLSLEEINDRKYFELFPTAYLQYNASANHSFALDYSRRISRPRYESLNPFRYFLNETNYNAGNPNLVASISNNFNLNYTLKNTWFFDFYYRDHGKSPETLVFQDNENLSIRYLSQNLLGSKGYGIDIFHGFSFTNWWYSQAFTSLFHQENTILAVESNNAEVTREVEGIQAYVYNIFTLSQDGSFEGTLFVQYVSDFLSGSYKLDPMTTVSVGLRKELWNKRAELSVNFNDIFNTTNTRLTSDYLNQSNSYASFEENRNVQIGFKYNFGNFRLDDNERSIEEVERERLNP